KVVDTALDAPEVLENVASRWGRQSEVYRLLAAQPRRACPVSLQNHNDEAWFRNIKIRRLQQRSEAPGVTPRASLRAPARGSR
ncbi:MAG TPA: hypothetical protein VFL57_20330, partial [Bryobacteraceae bacterium]|nr:hypothetical protein [Bryobacteraceae bacterium]